MPRYLGIDTSNYTTSLALYNSDTGELRQLGRPLPVKPGEVGLRQSDAVFAHVKQLGALARELLDGSPVEAVGVSVRPRDAEGSYMPCFLVGQMAGELLSSVLGAPIFEFSHQSGHIMAALWGAGKPELLTGDFLAFHLSGGTTECLRVSPGDETPFSVEILSQSADLYAGQLVDRVGAMLSLPFPSGPALEKLAEGVTAKGAKPVIRDGNPCLSGLENQCRNLLAQGGSHGEVAAFCIVSIGNILRKLTSDARERFPELPVIYAGGVMSNGIIRSEMEKIFERIYFAPPKFSSDNAAGVALLGCFRDTGEIPPCGC